MIWVVVIFVISMALFTIGFSSYRSSKRAFTVGALMLLVFFLIGSIFGGSLREHLNWGKYESVLLNAEDLTKFYKHLFNMSPNWFQVSVFLSPFIFYIGRVSGWYRAHQQTLSRVSIFELASFFKVNYLNPNRHSFKELTKAQIEKFSIPNFDSVIKVICILIIGLPVLYWLYE